LRAVSDGTWAHAFVAADAIHHLHIIVIAVAAFHRRQVAVEFDVLGIHQKGLAAAFDWEVAMNRKILTLVVCVVSCAGVLAAHAGSSAPEKIFENDGLKNSHVVKLKISGAKVSGIYRIENYDDSNKSKKFVELKSTVEREFLGTSIRTKTGALLKLFFAKGAPYQLAPNTKQILWRLGKLDGKEVLIVPTYGKNYQTGKYAAYEMQLDADIEITNTNSD
jgi:hypothetical protein